MAIMSGLGPTYVVIGSLFLIVVLACYSPYLDTKVRQVQLCGYISEPHGDDKPVVDLNAGRPQLRPPVAPAGI